MFGKRKRVMQLARETADVMARVFPDKTVEQRATVLTVFQAAHGGIALVDLARSHIDVCLNRLEYFANRPKSGDAVDLLEALEVSPGWEGVEVPECDGCTEFNAFLVEIMTGIGFVRDDEDEDERLVRPIEVVTEGNDDFKRWLLKGYRGLLSEK
jgi:hypothetical protein